MKKVNKGASDEDLAMLKSVLGYSPSKEQVEKDSDYLKQKAGGEFNRFKITDGETRLRFLPPKDSSATAYVRVKKHYLESDSKEGKNYVSLSCDGSDIACRAIRFLQARGGDDAQKIVKDLRAAEYVYFAAYNRDVEAGAKSKGQDVNISDAVGVLRASYTLANRVIGGLKLDLDAFHVLKGRDFFVRRDSKGKFPNYNDSQYDLKQSPLTTDKELLLKIVRAIPDLTPLLTPTGDDAEEAYKEVLGGIIDLKKMEAWEARQMADDEEDTASVVSEEEVNDFFNENSDVEEVHLPEETEEVSQNQSVEDILNDLIMGG